MSARLCLAIEISNPSAGPRGPVQVAGREVIAGPGVALANIDDAGTPGHLSTELLRETGRHDDDLMPAIDRLFKRHNAVPRDLARIAVSIGPGGFTSLRIAIATAKMLAEATGARTIPVQSWLVPLECCAAAPRPILVCLASKNDSAWAALDSSPDHPPRPLGIITAEQVRAIRPRTVVGDRFLPEPMRMAAADIGAALIEPAFAAEALNRVAAGHPPIDPVALAALYPRQPEAVTQWRRMHPQ